MKKNIEILASEDGSHTLKNTRLDETYHSIHGAYTESMHVFINHALATINRTNLNIFEIGFGTGLNAFLSFLFQKEHSYIGQVNYSSIELYPLQQDTFDQLNYAELFAHEYIDIFKKMHRCDWGVDVALTENFVLHKINEDLITFDFSKIHPDIVYFDAFSPDVQPQLWNPVIFEALYRQMNHGACLSTYCAKGQVRRDLVKVGFHVKRVPGPPGKREMLVAKKI